MTPEPSFTFDAPTNSELEIARTHVRQGNLAEAERVYRSVATAQPDQVEALRFLANAALSRGDLGQAVALLSRAAQADRANIGVLLELGVAYRSAERMDEARYVFERAMESSQGRNITARLLLAHTLEFDNRSNMALLHYFRAILDAQANGQWLDDSTTEPGLRSLVRHAMQYVAAGRHERFAGVLEPFRHGINAARIGRIDAALAIYLREHTATASDPRQRPTFLHLPDPGAPCFLDSTCFDWLADWSARASRLDGEARACIDRIEEPARLSPFSLESMASTGDDPPRTAETRLAPLYQRGIFQDGLRSRAPELSGMLDAAPMVHITNYAPNASILALPPGADIPPRYGRTNAFCMIATAFSGSAPLEITVGGESRRLQAGESLAFDPGFEFGFTATGHAQALALVFEVWNPGISRLERDALAALTGAVLDFDSQLQNLA